MTTTYYNPNIDYAVATAIGQGWTLARQDTRWAVLHWTPIITQPRKAGAGFHIINGVLTLLTLGLWLPVWLIAWFVYYMSNKVDDANNGSVQTQQLVIALDQDDNVTYEVRINGVTQNG
jgi:hypothetical protein